MAFTFTTEYCSDSQRNGVRLQTGIAFTFDRIPQLIDGNPKYRDSYERMLTFCLFPRSRDEIEKHFEGDPALVTPKLYPAALIGDLEEVGAIEWAEKWKTTDLAKEFLQ